MVYLTLSSTWTNAPDRSRSCDAANIDFHGVSCDQSIAMRHLTAILGILAMLVTLSGPVAALAAMAPCHDASMAMSDGKAPCETPDKVCAEPCLAAVNCQKQCGSMAPFARIEAIDLMAPPVAAELHVVESEQPFGTVSPVDGPPPRL